jgi:hypothetical protein
MDKKLFAISRVMFILGITMTLVLNVFRGSVSDFHFGLLFALQLVLLIGSAVLTTVSRKHSK